MILEMERMAVSMGDAVGWIEEDPAPRGEDLRESVLAVDMDGDGVADIAFPGVGVVSTGESWDDRMDRKRVSLWTSRSLAMMTQFRIGMKYQEHVAALGLVTQIELALIALFRESVPESGMVWDGVRRDREIQKRLARLRWVEREREREYGGFKGFLNRVMGRERVSGKELYQRMLEEADAMLSAMSQADRGDRVMHEVMRYTGSGDLMDRGRAALMARGVLGRRRVRRVLLVAVFGPVLAVLVAFEVALVLLARLAAWVLVSPP